MHVLERQFVSQVFGRATASLIVESDNVGHVSIVFSDPTLAPKVFTFNPAYFRSEMTDIGRAEVAMRIAIGRLHDEARRKFTMCAGTELSPEEAHWRGDFSSNLNAGTIGAQQLPQCEDDRRARDPRLHDAVAQGIALSESKGKLAARQFMRELHVPLSVVRRVLSRSTARRLAKTDQTVP